MKVSKVILPLLAILFFSNRSQGGNTPDQVDADLDGENGNGLISSGTAATLNMQAFLKTIQFAEGTYYQANPYAVTFSYDHVIQNFSDHPTNTGEWNGAPFGNTSSTAAGAYQFLVGTWNDLKIRFSPNNFSPYWQDRMAKRLFADRDSIELIEQGFFEEAIYSNNTIWASLPGSPYGQPQRSLQELKDFYVNQGGYFFYEIMSV